MSQRVVSTVIAVFVAWTMLAAQAPPQQPPAFRSGTTLVPVDVRVLDAKGQPIVDLRQDEFVVLEDGTPQPIRHFAATSIATGAPAGAPVKLRAVSALSTLQPQTSRVFLFVMGRGRLQPPSKGVDAAMQFARERALPQDQLAVFAWNRATDFSADHEAIARVLERFKAGHERIESDLTQYFRGLAIYGSKTIPPSIQARVDQVFDDRGVSAHAIVSDPDAGTSASPDIRKRADALLDADINTRRNAAAAAMGAAPNQARMTDAMDPVAAMGLEQPFDEYAKTTVAIGQDVAAVYAAIEYLRFIDGEKHLVFVTETGIALPRFDDDIAIARAATNARVAIDVIQTGGATADGLVGAAGGGVPPMMFDAFFRAQSIRTLAELTGGQASLYDYASNGLRKIDAATRFGYLLAYEAPKSSADSKYHHIEVRVTRKGAKVLYRHGYSGEVSTLSTDRRAMMSYVRMAQAATVGTDVRDIPIGFEPKEIDAAAGNVVAADITLGIQRIGFTSEPNAHRALIELSVFCANRDNGLVGQFSQQFHLVLTDAQLEHARQAGITVSVRVPIGKDHAHNVKVIAYNFDADVLGSVGRTIVR